mmetsp:Transcript_28642/g.56097  ORF Transcript_28642/g.56097 Transcript_28642/m.56097 type:complete len:98 (-) Transcript_28642:303-596(-)
MRVVELGCVRCSSRIIGDSVLTSLQCGVSVGISSPPCMLVEENLRSRNRTEKKRKRRRKGMKVVTFDGEPAKKRQPAKRWTKVNTDKETTERKEERK